MYFLMSWLQKCTHSSHYCSFLHFIKKPDRPFHNNLLAQSQFLLITIINLSVFPSSEVWSEMKGEKYREKNGEKWELGGIGIQWGGGGSGCQAQQNRRHHLERRASGRVSAWHRGQEFDHGTMLPSVMQEQKKNMSGGASESSGTKSSRFRFYATLQFQLLSCSPWLSN